MHTKCSAMIQRCVPKCACSTHCSLSRLTPSSTMSPNRTPPQHPSTTKNNAIETTLPPESELYGGNATNIEEIHPETKNIIWELMKQVRIGMDLSRVMIPVDFLEPQSLLERITVYCRMIYLLLEESLMTKQIGESNLAKDALQELNVQRMMTVLKWYLSAWHIRPPGVKKPYNPVLGEFHRCRFELPSKGEDSSKQEPSPNNRAFIFIAEQVSHHPPISAFYAETLDSRIIAEGWYFPKSKFLGNSAASEIQGELRLTFTELNQTYNITWPTVYARGIIFGRLVMEIGGDCTIACTQSGINADISFKNKPFIGGEYNCVSGRVSSGTKKVATFKGRWDSKITLIRSSEKKSKKRKDGGDLQGTTTSNGSNSAAASSTTLMDCASFSPLQKLIPREEFLLENESVRVWPELSKAVRARNLKEAQEAKYQVEEAQREKLREREKSGQAWTPKFFTKGNDGFWVFTGRETPEYQLMMEGDNFEDKERM